MSLICGTTIWVEFFRSKKLQLLASYPFNSLNIFV